MAQTESATAAPPVHPALVLAAILAMTLLFAALLMLPAGRSDWTLGWIYVGLLFAQVSSHWASLLRWNPELIDRRMRFGKGTKTWDKVWAGLFSPVMLAIYVVAGFDARDGVSSLPTGLWFVGLALFVPSVALVGWSMVVNPFFEKTVRIQTDRGQYVIDTGPYAYVRHPGYAGFLAWILGTPLLLASAWAFVPALLSVLGLVVRTALEDRTLRAELAGYPEYAARVRYRLIPGVW